LHALCRHGPDFKRKWKEGEIMRLDYNADDKPLRLLLPKEFVEEALQVVVTWDHEITDDGFQVEATSPRDCCNRIESRASLASSNPPRCVCAS